MSQDVIDSLCKRRRDLRSDEIGPSMLSGRIQRPDAIRGSRTKKEYQEYIDSW